jgi:hypothetical protein
LPNWVVPPLAGALVGGAIVIIRVTFFALTRGPSLGLLRAGGQALAIALWAGAAAGLAYGAVRPRLRSLRRAGDYVGGMACMAAAVVSYAVPSALINADSAFRTGFGWLAGAAAVVIGGAILGHSMFPELDRKDPVSRA